MGLLTFYVSGAILVGVIGFIGYHLVTFFTDYIRRRNMLVKFPHNKPHFIFGHMLEYPGPNDEGLAFQREMTERYPIAGLLWMMFIPMLIVSHPKTVSIILKSSDVILKCAMSYETNCQLPGNNHPYVNAVGVLSDIMLKRFFEPWFHNEFLFSLTPSGRKFFKQCDYVHQIAEEIIKERTKELQHQVRESSERSRRCMDFLDTLLTAKDEKGEGLTMREIRDEVDTFLFEGHDTTSSAISWALYSIAEHPEIQQRVQDELDGVLDQAGHTDVLWEDLTKLPYMTMVIKEAMRLHSPVPFIQRVLTSDTEIDGKMAPAGTLVNCVIYNIHHNPTVWEDSTRFDPDRFLPENAERRSPYAFVPFSAGPRVNIRLDPNHKVEKIENLIMRAKNDIKLLVTKR
ncbi:cytochrome P450 [Elysia marginata]|uniref:Cytochrome P450 n=1 Tax=Elysia marginata TaxID=1093978 RepID=A0AAV4IPT2_9GAST|nr:cytochrome P450 [Elysia marginata]